MWISSDDIGHNESYYLYSRLWYRMMSPLNFNFSGHADALRITEDGYIGNWHVEKRTGGVHIHELCYYNGRGWNSGEDDGNNKFFYLNSNIWYWTISIDAYHIELCPFILGVHENGYFWSHRTFIDGGGVQF